MNSESENISQNISKLPDQQLQRTTLRLTERDKENERRREFVETIERSDGIFCHAYRHAGYFIRSCSCGNRTNSLYVNEQVFRMNTPKSARGNTINNKYRDVLFFYFFELKKIYLRNNGGRAS